MDLILIIGSGAVGKMTVGQELMKITDFRLFHNHMMIEPVIQIFGKFDGQVVSKLREDIFDAFMKTNYQGMIFTFMWAFDMQADWDYIKTVTDKFEATGGTVYYVELVADQKVRLERNKTENRLANKASKRNLEISDARIIREETKYRVVSNPGELTFPNYIKIDNTTLPPDEVARMIKEHFNLPGPSLAEMMNRVHLEEVRDDELTQLLEMQKEAFMPLYEKYHDDGNPVLEDLDRIQARAAAPNRQYYFIVKDGARVGVINIGLKIQDDKKTAHIGPLFILPKYQNQGIGYVAMQQAFTLYPEANIWTLQTVLQESGACHLYEKCGFIRTGEEEIVNDKMTLIMYERKSNKD